MSRKSSRSHKVSQNNQLSPGEFVCQGLLSRPQEEVCSFSSSLIASLPEKKYFPAGAVFRDFDASVHSDCVSPKWVCFHEIPFQTGLRFPFVPLVSDFFKATGLSYSQVMPMVWRTLFWIDHVNHTFDKDLGLPEIADVYSLQTFGSSRFYFRIRSGKTHLVLKATHYDKQWKERFFFVRRDSIPDGADLPVSWIVEVPSFEKLFPAREDTSERIKEFLTVSSEDRSFKSFSSISEESAIVSVSSTMEPIDLDLSSIDAFVAQEPAVPPPSKRSKHRKSVVKMKNIIGEDKDASGKILESLDTVFASLPAIKASYDTMKDMLTLKEKRLEQLVIEKEELEENMKEISESKVVLQEALENKKLEIENLYMDKKRADKIAMLSAAIAVMDAQIRMASEAAEGRMDKWDSAQWSDKVKSFRNQIDAIKNSVGVSMVKEEKKEEGKTGDEMVVDEKVESGV